MELSLAGEMSQDLFDSASEYEKNILVPIILQFYRLHPYELYHEVLENDDWMNHYTFLKELESSRNDLISICESCGIYIQKPNEPNCEFSGTTTASITL